MFKRMRKKFHKTDKKVFTVFIVLRILIILTIISQVFRGNYDNAILCVICLFLFTLPSLADRKLHIELPSTLEIIIYVFIFSHEILGEINKFYLIFPEWDLILHTLNGFICAGIGFSLVNLLNDNITEFNLSAVYVCLVSFCFSMTVGIMWEFFEYSHDKILAGDMQKDEIVTKVSSVNLNKKHENKPVIIDGIDQTILHHKNGTTIISNGYLDIGLNDTMEDLFVNLIGAIIFNIFGFIYLKRKDKSFATNFIPTIKKET